MFALRLQTKQLWKVRSFREQAAKKRDRYWLAPIKDQLTLEACGASSRLVLAPLRQITWLFN